MSCKSWFFGSLWIGSHWLLFHHQNHFRFPSNTVLCAGWSYLPFDKCFFSQIQYVRWNQQDTKSVSNLLKTIRYLWQSQSKLYIVSRRKFSQKSYAVIDINQIILRSQCFQMAMPCWVFSISLIIPQPKDIFSTSPNDEPLRCAQGIVGIEWGNEIVILSIPCSDYFSTKIWDD